MADLANWFGGFRYDHTVATTTSLRIGQMSVSGDDFAVTFDPASGHIVSNKHRDRELLAGPPPSPNFYRAATDNDLGAQQTGKYSDNRI